MKKSSPRARFLVILGTMLALTLVSTLFGLVWPPLLTQAGPTLPPREPPPKDSPDGDDNAPLVATIELQVQPAQEGLWTVVQWEDSNGDWHDVEGWRGHLDEKGKKMWQVAEKDFGTGPFRWVLYQGQGGLELGASDPFFLPRQANEVVLVVLSL